MSSSGMFTTKIEGTNLTMGLQKQVEGGETLYCYSVWHEVAGLLVIHAGPTAADAARGAVRMMNAWLSLTETDHANILNLIDGIDPDKREE
jgi:hypothetical protein